MADLDVHDRDGWLFAYGSLMWDPGVPVAEALPAVLPGWRRSFCLRSERHRGTPERPGLVLGLDAEPGAACHGLALRIAAGDWPEALETVRARELVTHAYREAVLPVTLGGGRAVAAVAYVMRRDHRQYAGGLGLDEQAAIIAGATGGRGPNVDYLASLVRHLAEAGIEDGDFATLAARVAALRENASAAGGGR